MLFKGAVSAAADDPNVSRTQPVAQLGEDAELVVASVDRTARQNVPGPSLADEAGRGGFRQLEYRGLSTVALFISRSVSMARSSEAAAGTLWKAKVARKAGAQRRMPA